MKRIRTIFLMTIMVTIPDSIFAQYMTYNHDITKENQVTIMETGAGTLSPALFYELLHRSYSRTASSKNKLRYRSEAAALAYGQVPESEKVDSSLTARAKIEALNMADREIDVAWQAEGKKIEALMSSFKTNIDRILLTGGEASDKERWNEYYHIFKTAIKVTRNSYMPNSERKREYLHIYEDLFRENTALIKYISYLTINRDVHETLNVEYSGNRRSEDIAQKAGQRWKERVRTIQ